MHRYANRHESSGVEAFDLMTDGIRVRFHSGDVYTYTTASAGRAAINRMTQLAREGEGLSTFISRQNPRYARRDE